MPSTFADHVNRINSNSPDVVEAEKLWFGTLVENTYLRAPITYRENFAHFKRLTKNRFREEDTNLEYMSSPTTASSPTRPLDCIYPILHERQGKCDPTIASLASRDSSMVLYTQF
jgi:hypothetical protein